MIKDRVMKMILPSILGYISFFVIVSGISIVASTVAFIGMLVALVIDVRLALPIMFPCKYGYLLNAETDNKGKADKESNGME